MANIKISELPEATSVQDDDLLMIIQEGTNKKVTKEILLQEVNSDISDIQSEQIIQNADIQENETKIQELEQEIQNLKEASYKVSGTGTNVTLNNTSNNKFLKLDVKGNTEQTTLTGKNLFDKSNIVTDNRLSTTGGATSAEGYYISSYIPVIAGTTYTKNSPTADAYHRVCFYSSNSTSDFISASNDNTNVAPTGATYMRFCGLLTELDTTQVEKGSTATAFEPYCGGISSPNPTFPQSIKNVTGDVNVKIQNRNWLPFKNQDFTINGMNFKVVNGEFIINGTATAEISSRSSGFIENFSFILSPGTYYFKKTSGINGYIREYEGNNTVIQQNQGSFTITKEVKAYYGIYMANATSKSNVINTDQVELGSSFSSYVIHQEQNLPFTLINDNLFNKNKVTYGYYLNTQGTLDSANNYCVSDYIEIEEGKTYYISARGTNRTKFYNANKEALTSSYDVLSTDTTFTAPTNAKYIRTSINYTTISLDTFIICEGTSGTNCVTQRLYEGSYLADDGIHNVRKRIVLDGSEDEPWGAQAQATLVTKTRFTLNNFIEDIKLSSTDNGTTIVSNMFIQGNYKTDTNFVFIVANNSYIWVGASLIENLTLSEFKNLISTNNLILEYELATEEIIPYTETQQTQYNAIKEAMSYYGQTNISSTSNEASAKIDATAIGDLNLVIS